MGFYRFKQIAFAVTFFVVVAGLSVPFYQNLQVKSWRAEAKVMLSYMGTLQSAYHTDADKYAYFEEFYGSQIKGQEHCRRPEGAVELGFILRNCDEDPAEGGLRYSYRIVDPDKDTDMPLSEHSFKAEAVSGSDITGESFICLGSTARDVWRQGPDREASNDNYCD